ncbi:YgiQ family radical SAM protein [Candidatus Woesearchaeota archaeon]|nr:YgiQ family radical SAM protein [Candidatus Woesearchaeota archaeon]
MDKSFLPVSFEEGKRHYKDFPQFDVVFVTGDPYYDHPLSGMAIIARLLDKKGYKIGIIAQPVKDEDYRACGMPKYFFCITSGLLDSMLANYTPMLKKRENILVPERALMVYTQKLKQHFRGCVTVLGGVEATIRRFTHFDYRDNKLRRGILNDTKADLLLFGNAERSILTLLERMKKIKTGTFDELKDNLDLNSIEGVSFRIKKEETNPKTRKLPSYEECVVDKEKFNLLTRTFYLLPDEPFIEGCGKGFIQHNRPCHTLAEKEMDYIYGLPFTRELHPSSKNFELNERMVGNLHASVVIGRGCWGSCSFCVIPLVQGKEVAKRSKESIVKEIEALYLSGTKKINDLTLPTLNMYGSRCALYKYESKFYSPIIDENIAVYDKKEYCNQECVGCKFRVLSDDLYPLLEEVEKLNQKHSNTSLELRSAIRHDIIIGQKKLFRKIMQFVTRLKIAPENLSDTVLKQMNKATASAFKEFLEEYKKVNEENGTNKNLVPYFIAAHPGSTKESMEETRKFCRENDIFVNLTQVFTPTPGTLSTAMYYTGENPMTREKIHVPRTFREKKDQKNILLSKEEDIVDDNG